MTKTTTTPAVKVGDKIFNRGDMCNHEHFGTVIEVKANRWGTHCKILPMDEPTGRYAYWIEHSAIDHIDSGNGSTRIVTAKAHAEWRERELAKLRNSKSPFARFASAN
ncbi:hypothetical protein LCGC14_1035100 [marine sediment metagenome]|uniref:Uncharacterized protein n=1 Tax=marine sediment metagenome TaxID=412755 RepID=A0A0F9QZJ4_9ZZZZ